ncbi:MAG: 30S ribosomal protein S3 [Candidatus Nealsonbacteria bacterium CG_4_9_14_0_2_um_filter_37_38]|uniref:Small ribosomal subunit protein uS3 n=1 Tax=Candidatus Nealsonbacteria bacterium CG_4_10_14_0_8_um_filter_37_14 TaxID=1974684 RepID=A0A2M7R625_9BACT|nr:MAG: 30S ribosomal protein S3 [Candidatus Nealsonbacteria bacterium CG_4_8_14_3_um_filter_37_23]PIY88972.1 MAG: 30S ribosomal protein S3 [Candidatus Nealsonbacteria bacterium CG_4_10_14_0_8_um_filter_37_14]PJC51534.1 MAG: 30S ribosomal protein S3 [Candidatus Nealsonbacteria bacterium CG_4_9_14_0_2_um_filter_37_38]
MTHKVHPKAFRIKEISDWNSRGFYSKNLAKFLEEDFRVREILKRKLKDCAVEKIEIERFPTKINIIISSARPGLIIGRGGSGAEEIKKILAKEIFQNSRKTKKTTPSPREIKIEIKEIRNVWASPNLVAEWIAQRLEKRTRYRRVLKQVLDKIIVTKGVKGARVEVSGRLDGTEIARSEWLGVGKLPRQTIRADIDYGFGEAHCTYGIIGIKVWIYKGEKF